MAKRTITLEAVTCDFHAVNQDAPDVEASVKNVPLVTDQGLRELDLCDDCLALLHGMTKDFMNAARELVVDPSVRPVSSAPSPSAPVASIPETPASTRASSNGSSTSAPTTPAGHVTVRAARAAKATGLSRDQAVVHLSKSRAVPRMEGETPTAHKRRITKMRVWGRRNGYPQVKDYGQLPTGLPQAYWQAHPHEPH